MGQRRTQLLAADPAVRASDVGPAQTRRVLTPEEQISAAAVRIRIDEHHPASASHGGDGKRRGERARTRSPTPADHGNRQAQRGAFVDRVGQSRDQPRLGVRQQRDVLGADADRAFPDEAVVEVAAHQNDADPGPH